MEERVDHHRENKTAPPSKRTCRGLLLHTPGSAMYLTVSSIWFIFWSAPFWYCRNMLGIVRPHVAW